MSCDHVGSYTVYTRNYGYNTVRVYRCEMCGSEMALDTLPQYLLRRMYGELNRAEVRSGERLVPVDFCIILGGPSALLLSRMTFGSFFRTVSTIEGVTFHLVNIDIPESEFDSICKMFPDCMVHRRPAVPADMTRCLIGFDTEWSCNWTVENCGSNQFVVLCHFDLFFTGDFLNLLRRNVTERTGMLGQHNPFMLVNRKAFAQSKYRFYAPVERFYAVPRTNVPDQFYLYYEGDRRIPQGCKQTGFDIGELLELEMRVLGWETDALRDQYDSYFYHITGGGRVHSGVELESIRRRAKMFIEEYQL